MRNRTAGGSAGDPELIPAVTLSMERTTDRAAASGGERMEGSFLFTFSEKEKVVRCRAGRMLSGSASYNL